jgi:hypothetical protein
MTRLRLLALTLLFGASAAVALIAITPATAQEPKKVSADKTGISWEVEPPEVQIFLDDKKLGDAGKIKFTETKPGKHTVRLVLGKDETETEVSVKKGQTLKFNFSFDQG